MADKHPGGRPTKLTSELLDEARQYLTDNESLGPAALLPTIEGLSLKLRISRDTVYEWEQENEEFSDIVGRLRSMQGEKLIQNGLSGRYNATIAKLILSGKHGYVEKTEVDQNLTGSVAFINDIPRPESKTK